MAEISIFGKTRPNARFSFIILYYIKGQGSHASVAECTPLFIRIFAGSTDRESVIACIVCRDGPVFTLVGVLCAGSSQDGDTWILISTWLLAVNFGPRPLYPLADSRAHVQDMITGVREPSLYNTA